MSTENRKYPFVPDSPPANPPPQYPPATIPGPPIGDVSGPVRSPTVTHQPPVEMMLYPHDPPIYLQAPYPPTSVSVQPPTGPLNAIAIPSLGASSAPVDCPACGHRRFTRLEYQPGNTTHGYAALIFCFTGCLCFIPYMMNSLKDVKHSCGNCGVHLATWHRSGHVEVYMQQR
ncbi:LITAF-like zinc ribbon domain-containing protein [Tricladium varicosporioides]|nr:LITAF-like zinc ribbon domain-containing protein [Hymenoscyphus varicosporioides]